MYRTAMESLGSKPSESLFVSDAALDLQGAIEVGMHAAWIHRPSLGELAKPPSGSLVLAGLEDLGRIVKRYGKSGRLGRRQGGGCLFLVVAVPAGDVVPLCWGLGHRAGRSVRPFVGGAR